MPIGSRGPQAWPASYILQGRGRGAVVYGMGDGFHASRQSERVQPWAEEWAGLDESEIHLRGYALVRPGMPDYHTASPPPDFVLVRSLTDHGLFQVESTVSGARLTRPRPLHSAKLALATMRSVMSGLGRGGT